MLSPTLCIAASPGRASLVHLLSEPWQSRSQQKSKSEKNRLQEQTGASPGRGSLAVPSLSLPSPLTRTQGHRFRWLFLPSPTGAQEALTLLRCCDTQEVGDSQSPSSALGLLSGLHKTLPQSTRVSKLPTCVSSSPRSPLRLCCELS